MKHTAIFLSLLLGLGTAAAAEPESTSAAGSPVELPGADVVGNRELPIGLDIVPWRPAASGEVREGPTQLLDAPLEPIDPEVFRRELSIYQSSQP